MNKIKFRSDDPLEHAFSREVKRRVKAYFTEHHLSTHGNWSLYLKTAFMLLLYLVPFLILLVIPLPSGVAIFLTLFMGIGVAGIGMSIMHDAAHGAYSAKPWVNKFFASSMFILGNSTFIWRIQHNIKHHTYTNTYHHDPDIDTKGVVRLSEHAPLKKYHRYQHWYAFPLYGLMTFLMIFGEFKKLLEYNRSGLTRTQNVHPKWELIKLILVKVIYLSVILGLPWWLTSYSIWQILCGFAIIQVTAGIIMSTVFQMAHVVESTRQPLPNQNNEIVHDWFVHQLQTTADFGRKNGLLSWYIGGLDYQIEHHLFPKICHVHYPRIAPIVEATAREFGFTYHLNRSLGEALVSHFHRLKELGQKKVQLS